MRLIINWLHNSYTYDIKTNESIDHNIALVSKFNYVKSKYVHITRVLHTDTVICTLFLQSLIFKILKINYNACLYRKHFCNDA